MFCRGFINALLLFASSTLAAAGELDSVSDTELLTMDRVFADYRIGFNNRAAFAKAIRHLELVYQMRVNFAFARRNQVTSSAVSGVPTIYLDERYFDGVFRYVAFFEPLRSSVIGPDGTRHSIAEHQEAVARFILAHEYFHIRLQHLDTERGKSVTGVHTALRGNLLAQALEAQADWMAAVYVKDDLGLPLRWPAEFVGEITVDDSGELKRRDETNQGPDYLPHALRKQLVREASRSRPPAIAFLQPNLDCLEQLLVTDVGTWLLHLMRMASKTSEPTNAAN